MVMITADDFGLSPGITDGILRCIDDGLLDSVSLVPNGADFERAAAALRERKDMHVSVHINIVEGSPVSDAAAIPRLVGANGKFRQSFVTLAYQQFAPGRREVEKQLYQEIQAQVMRVREALGEERPIHLDSHQHVHMIPFVFDLFLHAARDFGLSRLRLSSEPLFLHFGKGAAAAYLGTGIIKSLVLGTLSAVNSGKLVSSGIRGSRNFIGILFTGRMTAAAAGTALAAVTGHAGNDDPVEVTFHPGRALENERKLWSDRPDLASFYLSEKRNMEAVELAGLRLPPGFLRFRGTPGR
jgi:predicted glycoside hydrolase/deacetylase ChbG (UPF0249 family)